MTASYPVPDPMALTVVAARPQLFVQPVNGSAASRTLVTVRVTAADRSPVSNVRIDLVTDRGWFVTGPNEERANLIGGRSGPDGEFRSLLEVDSGFVTPGVATIQATANRWGWVNLVESTRVIVVGPPAFVTVAAAPGSLVVGEMATVTATVTDAIGQKTCDGTLVDFTTNQGGVMSPTSAKTHGGVAVSLLLTSSSHIGPYVVIANVEGAQMSGLLQAMNVVVAQIPRGEPEKPQTQTI